MFFTTGADLELELKNLPNAKKGEYLPFNVTYYAQTYMQQYTGPFSPIEHFVKIGADRLFKPNASFDPAYYKSRYDDLKNTGFNAADLLSHFMKFGLDEGRAPNEALTTTFDALGYLAKYKPVSDYVNGNLGDFNGSASNGAIAHYVKFGQFQGFDIVTFPETGQVFTLTKNTDVMPGLIGSKGTTSNNGNDTITAIVENSASDSTLNSADGLNAGSGTDALNVRVISLTNDLMIAPVLNSIETVSVSSTDQSQNSLAINLGSSTGTLTVEFKNHGATADTTFINADTKAVISLDNADGSSEGQNVNLGSASGRTGNADAFTINIANGSGSVDLDAGFNLVDTTGTNDDTSFETANINVSGAASFITAGTAMAGLTTINVTGEATGATTDFGLVLGQVTGFNNLKAVNASGMTGDGLVINAINSAATGFVFLGSNAADVVLLDRDTVNLSGTLNGGLGKDVLATTSFSNVSTAVNRATGFEVLAVITPQSNLNASSFTGIHEFLLLADGGNLNITGVENNDRFVLEGDRRGSDETLRFTGENAGNSVVFEMRADDETGGEITIIANTNSGNDVAAVGFRNGISSVTIDSTGQNSSANLIEAVRTGNYNFYAFNNENGLANFTITGSQNLTIAAKEGVDLSSSSRTIGFQDAVNVNASSFTGVLRIAGSYSNDVITGGSGNDIIYGLIGNDTLTGNGGSDQFRMVGARGTDLIKDFAQGIDKIGTNNVDFSNTTATSAGATLSALDYVDNRSGITSIGAADDKKVIELQTALSTSQIQTDTGAAVTAYVLVFNSTTSKAELWFDSNWSDGGRSQVATFDNITSLVELTGFKNVDFVEFIA
jgi:hypothetical protein